MCGWLWCRRVGRARWGDLTYQSMAVGIYHPNSLQGRQEDYQKWKTKTRHIGIFQLLMSVDNKGCDFV